MPSATSCAILTGTGNPSRFFVHAAARDDMNIHRNLADETIDFADAAS